MAGKITGALIERQRNDSYDQIEKRTYPETGIKLHTECRTRIANKESFQRDSSSVKDCNKKFLQNTEVLCKLEKLLEA